MQLSRSIFCLLFLCGIHFGVCALRGEIASDSVNIAPQFTAGQTIPACVVSLADIPSGWLVIHSLNADASSSLCPNPGGVALTSVTIKNLNGMAAGSIVGSACVSTTDWSLPAGWMVTQVAASSGCVKVGNIATGLLCHRYYHEHREQELDQCLFSAVVNQHSHWLGGYFRCRWQCQLPYDFWNNCLFVCRSQKAGRHRYRSEAGSLSPFADNLAHWLGSNQGL
jgi:hypothetical protein